MKRNRVTLTCKVCGKEYETHAYRAETSLYCSKECWSHRGIINAVACLYCGNSFVPKEGGQQLCSWACRKKFKVGINASRWKDGQSLERQRARLGTELREWRNAVYIRDNYTCQQCGAKGKIQAHHIKPWAEYPESRFDVSNGITLCIDCHGQVHGINFSNRRKKTCADCGKTTSGRGERCRMCALTLYHQQSGHKQPRTCPQCQEDFMPRNHTRIYCSKKCAALAKTKPTNEAGKARREINRIGDPVTVKCANCDKEIRRLACKIKNSKTGKFFCCDDCKIAHSRRRVNLTCPICENEFTVKLYRTLDGKQLTCSRICHYKHVRLQHALPPPLN